ncbi:MAG: GTP-binding protein, partial [Methanoregula sp.]
GYPMDVQLNLLDEVKGMVEVPLVVVANKSDISAAEGYLTMSTHTGDGVDAVLAEILTHKPERVERKKDTAPDIRSPLPQEPEEPDLNEGSATDVDGKPMRKPKPKRARKPRTVVSRDSV